MSLTKCHVTNRKLSKMKKKIIYKLSVIKYHWQKINMRHGRPGPVIPGHVRESAEVPVCQTMTNRSESTHGLLNSKHT